MTDTHPTDNSEAGMDRRSLIKRSAIVGGALVWTTPIVQSLSGTAFAQTAPGSPPPQLQGCFGGGSATARYYIKFEMTTRATDFGTGTGGCVPESLAGTVADYPPGTSAANFTISGITRLGAQGTDGATQTVTITLPVGFTVDSSTAKAGTGTSNNGPNGVDDFDADTGKTGAAVVGCIDDIKTSVTQAGQVVTLTTTNTDGVDPNISFVAITYIGCVPR